MILSPLEIERESFRLIREEFKRKNFRFPEELLPLILRVVHATGDVNLAKELVFHPRALEAGLSALSRGATLLCDVEMVAVGLNKVLCQKLSAKVVCLLNETEIRRAAQKTGLTRSYLAMKKGLLLPGEKIVLIGNAPTALLAVLDHLKEGLAPPALIIGVPVGFVGAQEYKERLLEVSVPFITLRGTRGGTPVAVSLANALLRLASSFSCESPAT